MRLIDADVLNHRMATLGRLARSDAQKALLGRALYIVDNMPTVDAEPVRHGTWTDGEDQYWVRATCSVCGSHPWRGVIPSAESLRASGQYNYCPTCGAKMDGDAHAAD